MGAVFKGRDPDLGRDLAVKVLLDAHKDKPELVRRFVEEAQIGGQLQHPGVVLVYELGNFGDCRPNFTMKLVKGQTLSELLSERKSPVDDLPKFLAIFQQICQTMAYAHARDVIHRDLKPSNVMVGSFGEVQVMDWGLAKVLPRGGVVDDAAADRAPANQTVIAARVDSDSDLSQSGSVMGTPAYMAPEQARGEIELVDERADVFALGSILCEILTGRPAFVGRNSGEIHRKRRSMTGQEYGATNGTIVPALFDCRKRPGPPTPIRGATGCAMRSTPPKASSDWTRCESSPGRPRSTTYRRSASTCWDPPCARRVTHIGLRPSFAERSAAALMMSGSTITSQSAFKGWPGAAKRSASIWRHARSDPRSRTNWRTPWTQW